MTRPMLTMTFTPDAPLPLPDRRDVSHQPFISYITGADGFSAVQNVLRRKFEEARAENEIYIDESGIQVGERFWDNKKLHSTLSPEAFAEYVREQECIRAALSELRQSINIAVKTQNHHIITPFEYSGKQPAWLFDWLADTCIRAKSRTQAGSLQSLYKNDLYQIGILQNKPDYFDVDPLENDEHFFIAHTREYISYVLESFFSVSIYNRILAQAVLPDLIQENSSKV